MKPLSDVGEIGLLRVILPTLRQRRDVARGPGDDCAVLRLPDSPFDLLATTDPVIEGRHYLPDTPLALVARKAVARALSDLAAMGGTPRWLLTDVTAAPDTPADKVSALYAGLEKAARHFHVSIVGGDLAEARELQVHIVALGTCPRGTAVLRSTARPGDLLLVTGRLGASWADGNLHQFTFLPRLAQGRWLAQNGYATAMMDLSDGLGADLPRLLDASGDLGCLIRPDAIPCSPFARRLGGSPERAIARAWNDGEDFELLLAIRPRWLPQLLQDWAAAFPRLPLTPIGQVLPSSEPRVLLSPDGTSRPFPKGGFDHFSQA